MVKYLVAPLYVSNHKELVYFKFNYMLGMIQYRKCIDNPWIDVTQSFFDNDELTSVACKLLQIHLESSPDKCSGTISDIHQLHHYFEHEY
jgi:hypothetical protein